MLFALDLRFVFVLRCLYRQGRKNKKAKNSKKKPDFWQKQKKELNFNPKICKYERKYTSRGQIFNKNPRKEGNAHVKKY